MLRVKYERKFLSLGTNGLAAARCARIALLILAGAP
jgi:hypothetical protein